MDIEDLVDDFVTFYIAGVTVDFKLINYIPLCSLGQETTGNLLSITTVLIHQHPDVLCR